MQVYVSVCMYAGEREVGLCLGVWRSGGGGGEKSRVKRQKEGWSLLDTEEGEPRWGRTEGGHRLGSSADLIRVCGWDKNGTAAAAAASPVSVFIRAQLQQTSWWKRSLLNVWFPHFQPYTPSPPFLFHMSVLVYSKARARAVSVVTEAKQPALPLGTQTRVMCT